MTAHVRNAWLGLLILAASPAVAVEALPPGFVRLRDLAPGIAQDMRYATPFNFLGQPVAGYGAPDCVLTRAAAEALIRVDAGLRRSGYGLKLFDCYRPARAVQAFLSWAKDGRPALQAGVFHPDIAKDRLVARGFIGAASSHSRGSTVDVGLVRADEPALPTPAGGGRCDGPFAERPRESSLDLGTSFDCFSQRSAVADASVGAEARRNRGLLRAAMSGQGFRGYSREWWHFTLVPEPYPKQQFDFAIE